MIKLKEEFKFEEYENLQWFLLHKGYSLKDVKIENGIYVLKVGIKQRILNKIFDLSFLFKSSEEKYFKYSYEAIEFCNNFGFKHSKISFRRGNSKFNNEYEAKINLTMLDKIKINLISNNMTIAEQH